MMKKIKKRTTKETRRCRDDVGKRTPRPCLHVAGSILSVIKPAIIDTMLNNNGHGLKNDTCKVTLNLRKKMSGDVVMMMTTTTMIVVRINEHFT